MTKRIFLILVAVFVMSGIVYSRQITFNEAQIVAENWTQDLEEKFNDQVRIYNGREIIKEGIIVAYVFDLYPKGFVIIAPQDYLPPIKMYSTESDFEGSGGPLNDIIFKSNLKIIQAVDKGDLSAEKNFSGRNKKVFESYLRGDIKYNTLSSLKADVTQEVEPLLSTTWGQGGPYNNYCPVINGKTTYTGCNATALSQILNYYEWPLRGSGSETYYLGFGRDLTIYTSFDKEYEWWNMLDEYGSATEEENNAVSTLMFDVGVAIHSSYFESDTSAGYDFHYNFIDHFHYSPDLTHVQIFHYQKGDEWFNVAKNQVDNGWPCELGISGTYGHSVVIDGYRISGSSKMIHLNMGWSGSHNGYFAMDNIYINDLYDFTRYSSQTMTINLYPYPEYKRPVGLPPVTITAEAFLNRSVFLSEYIVRLTWPESPSEDKRIAKYIIYQKDGEAVSEVERVDPGDGRTYEFRTKDLSGISYSVGVIDKNGVISDMPAFVTPGIK